MMEYIEKFKIIWSNKRYHALILLGLYILFFAFVFLLISEKEDVIPANNTTQKEELTGLELFKTEDNYIYNIKGIYEVNVVDNGSTINYLNNSYTVDTIVDALKIYDFSLYTPLNIYKIIESSTLESTNYINNTNTYVITQTSFDKLIYGLETRSDYSIKIITYLNDKNIKKVEIYFATYTLTMEVE